MAWVVQYIHIYDDIFPGHMILREKSDFLLGKVFYIYRSHGEVTQLLRKPLFCSMLVLTWQRSLNTCTVH